MRSERHEADVSVNDIICGLQTRRIHIVYIIISGKQSFTLIIHGTCPATPCHAMELSLSTRKYVLVRFAFTKPAEEEDRKKN
jgi:hypothetical protein